MKISDEMESEILELSKSMTKVAIAAKLGISRCTVARSLRRMGVDSTRFSPTDKELVRLYRKFKSINVVADVLGMSTSGAAYRLRKLVVFYKRPPLSEKEQERIATAYENRGKRTLKDIAYIHGVAPHTVTRILQRRRARGDGAAKS